MKDYTPIERAKLLILTAEAQNDAAAQYAHWQKLLNEDTDFNACVAHTMTELFNNRVQQFMILLMGGEPGPSVPSKQALSFLELMEYD